MGVENIIETICKPSRQKLNEIFKPHTKKTHFAFSSSWNVC